MPFPKKIIYYYAKLYNLKIKFVGKYLYVESIFDKWYIKEINNEYKYYLYHQNSNYNHNYHRQKQFKDIKSCLYYIYKHDNYKLKKWDVFKYGKTAQLFAIIENELKNKKEED